MALCDETTCQRGEANSSKAVGPHAFNTPETHSTGSTKVLFVIKRK